MLFERSDGLEARLTDDEDELGLRLPEDIDQLKLALDWLRFGLARSGRRAGDAES